MLVFQPMPLGRKPLPFDDPAYLFELKYDGFRALAVVEYGRCTLYSRNGHPFASFRDLATRIGNALMPRSLVMDGEIVCLDEYGRCRFSELLFRRNEPRFIAFDLLHASGKDLRRERLLDTKHELRRIIGNGLPPIIFADHIYESGIALFEKACELDLEGIVIREKESKKRGNPSLRPAESYPTQIGHDKHREGGRTLLSLCQKSQVSKGLSVPRNIPRAPGAR